MEEEEEEELLVLEVLAELLSELVAELLAELAAETDRIRGSDLELIVLSDKVIKLIWVAIMCILYIYKCLSSNFMCLIILNYKKCWLALNSPYFRCSLEHLKFESSLKSIEIDRIDKMGDDAPEDLDFGDVEEGPDEELEDDTELEFGVANIPGIKPELKKLYGNHPELIIDYTESLINRIPLKVVQPSDNKPDPQHTTYPFVTLYEKTKVIGLRANQLSQGARPFIVVPKEITDVRDIARLEFHQKRLPYIIKRPLPDGTFEVWRLADLMIL